MKNSFYECVLELHLQLSMGHSNPVAKIVAPYCRWHIERGVHLEQCFYEREISITFYAGIIDKGNHAKKYCNIIGEKLSNVRCFQRQYIQDCA